MSDANVAILAKIGKLLKLATSNNPNEAANAAAQAQRLMDEHRLTMEDVSVEADPMVDQTIDGLDVRQRVAWKARLHSVVGSHNGCFCLMTGPKLRLIGRRSDVQLATFLYEYLAREVDRLTREQGHGLGRAYANAFRHGAVTTIGRKLVAERQRDAVGSASSALVLQRDAAARDWFTQTQGGKVRTVTLKAGSNAAGYHAGIEAGKRVELRRGVEGGTVPEARRLA